MEIPKHYAPQEKEEKWYAYWLRNGFFRSEPDPAKEPFTITIPPPNVTGVLHMGHILNNTLQDVLVRRARMTGKNALWVPGTDHASIATEAKVVNKLAEQGIRKADLSREQFLEHCWEWTHKHGGIILQQLKKLGASCDWDRTKFTMDEDLSESVLLMFEQLHDKGLIYRGYRMVHWDPKAKTALSDEEVVYREEQSKLYHVRYAIEGEQGWLTIATTRPETILGDTAICVHPDDPRYAHLRGKRAIVPLVGRSVPIIFDAYVDMEFGTGALKVTPAHDANDYELGQKHGLRTINIFNDDATLSPEAGMFVGLDRFQARKDIVPALEQAGNLVKVEDYLNKVGYSERTHVPIEPRVSMQWFLKMKELSQPALEAVVSDQVRLHPPKFKNTYKHWMENVRDWCISRQLWWGHRIPAYYLPGSDDYVVATTPELALERARLKTGRLDLQAHELRQDPDALDTWFSSWLWPISVFDGVRHPDNPQISYYYPTNDLVTAPEILFFWVARMIIAGYELRGQMPFRNVYLTGIVRDKQRRKMSKSLGNSPDPLDLIAQYGADSVRVGMLLCSPAGNDLLYDEGLIEQGRNFTGKIWNAARLVKGWSADPEAEQSPAEREAIAWFEQRLNQAVEQLDQQYAEYRISEALMNLYRLFWDEFSSWFLEFVKPEAGKGLAPATLAATLGFFDELLRLLHPFTPFITEELWHLLEPRQEGQTILYAQQRKAQPVEAKVLENMELAKGIITEVRRLRTANGIAMKEGLELLAHTAMGTDGFENLRGLFPLIQKMARLDDIRASQEKPANASSFVVKQTEYFLPLGQQVDAEAELAKLRQELDYARGFRDLVMKKLSNPRFVDGAPAAVVEKEQQKRADAEAKIQALEARMASFGQV